jgi:hypothetical protein
MKYILAVLAGTATAFVWILISRMTLPWYTHEFRPFQDEGVMSIVLKDQTPQDGLYSYPAVPGDSSTTQERYRWYEKAASGPFYFVAVKGPSQRLTMRDRLLIKLGVQFLIAVILLWVIGRMGPLHPLATGLVAGLLVSCGAISEDLRAWNWWSLPDQAAFLSLADVFLRWFLAGTIMALITRDRQV